MKQKIKIEETFELPVATTDRENKQRWVNKPGDKFVFGSDIYIAVDDSPGSLAFRNSKIGCSFCALHKYNCGSLSRPYCAQVNNDGIGVHFELVKEVKSEEIVEEVVNGKTYTTVPEVLYKSCTSCAFSKKRIGCTHPKYPVSKCNENRTIYFEIPKPLGPKFKKDKLYIGKFLSHTRIVLCQETGDTLKGITVAGTDSRLTRVGEYSDSLSDDVYELFNPFENGK